MQRIMQRIVNDVLENLKVSIKIDTKTYTSICCPKLFNMTDKEFKTKYLSDMNG